MEFFKCNGKLPEEVKPLTRMSDAKLAELVKAITDDKVIQKERAGVWFDMIPRNLEDFIRIFLSDMYGSDVGFRVKPEEVQKSPKPVELYKNCSYLVQTNEFVSRAVWIIRSECIMAAKRGESVLIFNKRYLDELFKVHILSAIEIIKYELPIVKETDEEIVFKLV